MGELHPSPTARTGNIPTDAVTKGLHKDISDFPASKEVWCAQCGFRCNLARDAKDINEFAGESIAKGFSITDHDYDAPSEDHDYDGSGRTISSLSAELSNGSFEDWTAGDPDSWTLSGTVTQTTSDGYFDWSDGGVSSAKIIRSGSTISLSQAMATPSDFNSNIVIFRVRVKSLVNGVVRLRAVVNSTNYYSSYNVAQQRFQELSVIFTCPATVSSLTVYILADNADGTAYVDQVILMRHGNPTTASVNAGCPMCGSFNYFLPPERL